MQMSDYMNHLFSYVPRDRLDTFSYGHVIPSENLTANILARGVSGAEFDFTYDGRDSEKTVCLPAWPSMPDYSHFF
jgi:chromosome transmission fidelity protein 1